MNLVYFFPHQFPFSPVNGSFIGLPVVSICADSDDGWEVVIHERATGINSSSGDELRSVAAAADSYFGGFFGWRIGEVEIEPPTPTG